MVYAMLISKMQLGLDNHDIVSARIAITAWNWLCKPNAFHQSRMLMTISNDWLSKVNTCEF